MAERRINRNMVLLLFSVAIPLQWASRYNIHWLLLTALCHPAILPLRADGRTMPALFTYASHFAACNKLPACLVLHALLVVLGVPLFPGGLRLHTAVRN